MQLHSTAVNLPALNLPSSRSAAEPNSHPPLIPVSLQENCLSAPISEALQRMYDALAELSAQTEAFEVLERDLSEEVGQLLAANHIPRLPDEKPDGYDFALQLVHFPTIPLYIKRRFDLSFRVVSRNASPEALQYPLFFMLSVRKMDNSAGEITKARSGRIYAGKAFLRGQLAQAFTEGQEMVFKQMTFTDISSVYPQGRVNMVVHCVNNSRVKPLLIEGVRVKARKKRPDEVL